MIELLIKPVQAHEEGAGIVTVANVSGPIIAIVIIIIAIIIAKKIRKLIK